MLIKCIVLLCAVLCVSCATPPVAVRDALLAEPDPALNHFRKVRKVKENDPVEI